MNRKQYLEYLEKKEKIETDYLEKRYSTKTETILVDKNVVSKYKTKTKKSKIIVSTYQSSSNHKIVQISELYYDYYTDDYEYSKKNILIPIKDFKHILKQLNDNI
jgi:hypothetical protein